MIVTATLFSLLPGMLQSGEYAVTFGRGYGIYERHGGIDTKLNVFTDFERNVKVSVCEIENNLDVEKNISLYYFMEPVLGDYKESHERNVVAQIDETGALCVTNAFSYVKGMAYIYTPANEIFYTSLKEEFFGHFGSVYKLNALNMDTLSNPDRYGSALPGHSDQAFLKAERAHTVTLLAGFCPKYR